MFVWYADSEITVDSARTVEMVYKLCLYFR